MACKKLIWGKSSLCGDGKAKSCKGVDNTIECNCEQCGGAEDVTMMDLLRANIAKKSVKKMRDEEWLAAYRELLEEEYGQDPMKSSNGPSKCEPCK